MSAILPQITIWRFVCCTALHCHCHCTSHILQDTILNACLVSEPVCPTKTVHRIIYKGIPLEAD